MPNKKGDDEEVLTPGGKRPKSAVHYVQPGEAVEGDVKEAPPGMHPESGAGSQPDEPTGMRPESGAEKADTSSAKDPQPGTEPAGMRPGSSANKTESAATEPVHGTEPVGMRPESVAFAAAEKKTASADDVPEGMIPKSAAQFESDDPAGMRPSSAALVETLSTPAASATDLVRTPGGYRLKSMVHEVEPGALLAMAGDVLKSVDVA